MEEIATERVLPMMKLENIIFEKVLKHSFATISVTSKHFDIQHPLLNMLCINKTGSTEQTGNPSIQVSQHYFISIIKPVPPFCNTLIFLQYFCVKYCFKREIKSMEEFIT